MKTFYPYLAMLFFGILTSGCLNDLNKIPPNCFDGIVNNGELEVDCGGPCIACDPCENGLWDYELGETWVDCGGDCGDCPPHANGCQDEGESGIDCGGTSGIDCATLCDDGLPNGWENGALNPVTSQPWNCDEIATIIYGEADCGQGCGPCETCNDGILNQDELWIDCGGICNTCVPVSTGSCINGFIDGDEIDIDCGALPDSVGFCPQCELQLECYIDGVFYEFEYNLTSTRSTWINGFGTERKTITFSGIAENGWELNGQIAEHSLAGWNLNSEMSCNQNTYNMGIEGSYLTIIGAELPGGSVTTEFIIAPSPGITYKDYTLVQLAETGYVKGEFEGTCITSPPLYTNVNITGGSFKLIHAP